VGDRSVRSHPAVQFREMRETTENTFIVAANLRMLGWAQLRASYETGERDHGAYNLDRSEHASYAEPEDIGILPSLRRFDQAKRDVDRFFGLLQLTPGGDFTVSLSYPFSEEDYRREPVVDASGLRYGLVDSKSQSFTAEADYSPGDRWSLYGFYTREKISNFLRGRQSGATPSTNPLDDWTSDMDDKVDSFGGGATVALLPDRLDLRALVRYQKLNGNNDLASPAGAASARRPRAPSSGVPCVSSRTAAPSGSSKAAISSSTASSSW
jgi:hypothetical protein